jgi:hypothetical protein
MMSDLTSVHTSSFLESTFKGQIASESALRGAARDRPRRGRDSELESPMTPVHTPWRARRSSGVACQCVHTCRSHGGLGSSES